MIAGLLGIVALGVALEILLEGGAGSLVVSVTILRHSQQIQALLGILASLLQGYLFGQQDGSILKLAFGEAFFGILVLVRIVRRLVNPLKFRCATRHQSCTTDGYNIVSFHHISIFDVQNY